MIPQTQLILKSYFETGDVPTQAEFAELIDTMFYNDQQALTDAATALAAAEEAQDSAAYTAKVLLRSTSSSNGDNWSKDKSLNVATVTFPSGKIRVTFTTAFEDANYIVNANISGTIFNTANAISISSITATTTYVEFTLSGLANNGAKLNVSIFNT